MLAEGQTEKVAERIFKQFLDAECSSAQRQPVGLKTIQMTSELLRPDKLGRAIRRSLEAPDVVGVLAFMDVRTSGRPRQFQQASEVIDFLNHAAPNDARFRAHAAQYDFEAWLLPYWDDICRRAGFHLGSPGANPETVNYDNPPSRRLADLYRRGRKKYNKPRDALAILSGKDLRVSAAQCSQLKALLNSLLTFAGCPLLG